MNLITTAVCLISGLLPLHRDIDVTSVGVQDKRTEVVFFPDEASALKGNIEQSPFYSRLNGE